MKIVSLNIVYLEIHTCQPKLLNLQFFQEQISELKTKFSEVEQDLIRAKNQRDGEKEQFEKELQHKVC